MNRLKFNNIVQIPQDNPVILYKKLNPGMISPYQYFKYEVGKTYSVEEFNNNTDDVYGEGRIYSIPKNELRRWDGILVFEVHVWGKCILCRNDPDEDPFTVVGSQHIKITEKLKLDRFIDDMDSEWAYHYCKNIKDEKKVRNKITDSIYAVFYCQEIKDRKELRDRITDSFSAYHYCKMVTDRKEVRDRITDSGQIYFYCKKIKDRKDMRDKIIRSYCAYCYCKNVKDRKSIRDKIVDPKYAYWYCKDIRDRKEVRKYITDPYYKNLYTLWVNGRK